MPTVPVMDGNIKEEEPPNQPTPRREALASERKIMQAIRAIGQPVTKHACCMAPDTPLRSVKYSRKNPRSMLRRGPTKTNNPATAENTIMVSLLINRRWCNNY